jgi:two-component system, cell cycle sensor histidine kinase and response regulator CckA
MSHLQRMVLIIDDSSADRELYRRYLLRDPEYHYTIQEAHLGQEGIEQWQHHQPDVVLLDYQLPDLDGLAVLTRLKQQVHELALPVIVITGQGDEAIAVQAIKAGAQDYLIKGQLTAERLYLAVNAAISTVQLRTQLQQSLERERQAHDALEIRVQERTAELIQINAQLQQEMSGRKQAEETIREQAALIDISPDAIFVRDLEYRVLFWNRGAEQMYGWTAAEMLGQDSQHLLKQRNAPQETALKTILEKGEWQGELTKVTKSGKEIIVASRWTLMHDDARQPKSILSVETNITEQKQLEAQFLRAQRLESLGTLAGGIAHDMNNLLTPMLAVAQLLPLKCPNLDAESLHLLKILQDNSKRGANLVKQILTFARGLEGEHSSLQVGHLLSELEQIIRSTFPKSIELSRSVLTEPLWLVTADATQLHQVFMNLCVNARDAMPEGGTLSVTAENILIDEPFTQLHLEARIGPYVMITIADTGTGMSADVRERIFEPFFTTKDFGKGTGLGLSTVLGIIKSHGGFIEVLSEVGCGSQFKVYLPAIVTTEVQPNPSCHLPLGQGDLILVVDDEAPIRQTTQTILETYNYQVLTANDGIDAIALYAQHQGDVKAVLMDLMMPELGGIAAMRALQKINPQVKVLIASGLGLNYQQAVQELGTKTVLAKPYTTQELLNTLHRCLKD